MASIVSISYAFLYINFILSQVPLRILLQKVQAYQPFSEFNKKAFFPIVPKAFLYPVMYYSTISETVAVDYRLALGLAIYLIIIIIIIITILFSLPEPQC